MHMWQLQVENVVATIYTKNVVGDLDSYSWERLTSQPATSTLYMYLDSD